VIVVAEHNSGWFMRNIICGWFTCLYAKKWWRQVVEVTIELARDGGSLEH
jgi:hypothetical protein